MKGTSIEDYLQQCPAGCLVGVLSQADPPDPPEGCFVIWQTAQSDVDGDAGDVEIKATYNGVTKVAVLINFTKAA